MRDVAFSPLFTSGPCVAPVWPLSGSCILAPVWKLYFGQAGIVEPCLKRALLTRSSRLLVTPTCCARAGCERCRCHPCCMILPWAMGLLQLSSRCSVQDNLV